MDRATLTLLGTAEYLAHLAKARCQGRARQQAVAALDRIKRDLLESAVTHGEALNNARNLLRATADSLRLMFDSDPEAAGVFEGLGEVTVREVYPPPLPSSSSSSSGGGPIRSLPPMATAAARGRARRP